MQNAFPKASVSDCQMANRRQCIMQWHRRHCEHTFKVSFLPRHSFLLCEEADGEQLWFEGRIYPGACTSLSKRVKSSLIRVLTLFAVSWCASRCFLDFRRGLLTWNQRKASQFFFSVCLGRKEKKKKKEKTLAAFVFGPGSAESIKPAHQLEQIPTAHELLRAAHRLGAVTEGRREDPATWAPQLHLLHCKLSV